MARKKALPAGFKERIKDGEYIGLEYRFTYNNKRYSVYGQTIKECKDKEAEKRIALAENLEKRTDPTLDQFNEKWTEGRAGTSKESTLRCQFYQYMACADVVIETTGKRLGDMKLREISVQDIRDVQRALRDPDHATFKASKHQGKDARTAPRKPRTTNSTNGAIAHLSHVFEAACEERLIDYNPCRPVKDLQRTEKPARETIHRALSEDEQRAFFEEASNSWYYDLLRFLVATGARIGEAGALVPSDVHDGKLHIVRTVTRNELGGYEIGTSTKTWHGKREIPVNDLIQEILAHQQTINRQLYGAEMLHFPAKNPTPEQLQRAAIFKSPERKILRNEAVDREIARICKRAGIEKITAHALRATFATRAIEQGVAPRTLQEILGHADFSITMNLYGHVLDKTKKEAMEQIHIAI